MADLLDPRTLDALWTAHSRDEQRSIIEAALAAREDTEQTLTRAVSKCCKARVEVGKGFRCSACGRPYETVVSEKA